MRTNQRYSIRFCNLTHIITILILSIGTSHSYYLEDAFATHHKCIPNLGPNSLHSHDRYFK